MVALNPSELHSSLADPVLGSIGFLNEVMSRYPDAISFAPGAPHTSFTDDLDTTRYTDAFLNHLVRDKGYSPVRARRLLFEYGPSRGLINHLVSDALRRDQGIAAAPAAVVITVGAQEAMLLALRALFRYGPQDVLAVANPCFVGITGAASFLDIPLVSIEETDDGINLAALEAACLAASSSGRRVRACYVAADFSNPGGGRMSLECRHKLLALADSRDFLILEDNAYGFTAADGKALPCLKALDAGRRVIHIGTFAKVCFPGARVGYVVADQSVGADGADERLLADELAALKSVVTVNTSPLSQAVIGGMLLKHGSLSGLSGPKSEFYQRNLTLLLAAMDRHLADGLPPGVRWNRPAGGFFVRVKLPVRADLDLLETSAAQYGVLWTPMSQFYLDGAGDFQLRLSCSYLDPEAIEEGMRRLAAFLKKETWS
jgi:(S)-3,5-dihydroxyphenylglycine transaminase